MPDRQGADEAGGERDGVGAGPGLDRQREQGGDHQQGRRAPTPRRRSAEELALLDTIPAPVGEAELAKARIKYLTVAPMFAEAIERTYQEISIAKLFN